MGISGAASSEPIYKWTDAQGKIHYSTEPRTAKDKPAKLPNLTKIDLDKQIERIKEQTPRNCSSHGGEDCSAGADADGSVICADGYKDAILPFRFHCMQVRLEASLSVMLEGEEMPSTLQQALLDKTKTVTGILLSLRNLSGVEAIEVMPAIRLSRKYSGENTARRFIGKGKRTISAYGVESYLIPLKTPDMPARNSMLRALMPAVSCTNCSSVRTQR